MMKYLQPATVNDVEIIDAITAPGIKASGKCIPEHRTTR